MLQPRQDRVQVVLRVVVAEDRAVEVGWRTGPAVAAQVVAGGERGVVDVVGVVLAVAVAVAARPRPGGRDGLQGADGVVVAAVAVVDAVVGVLGEGEAVAVELGRWCGRWWCRRRRRGRRGPDRDPTLPMAASSCHGRLQPGLDRRSSDSAFLYASRTVRGCRPRRSPGGGGARGRGGVGAVEGRQVGVYGRCRWRSARRTCRTSARCRRWSVCRCRRPSPRGPGTRTGLDRDRRHGGGERLAEPAVEMRHHQVNPSVDARASVFRCRTRPSYRCARPVVTIDRRRRLHGDPAGTVVVRSTSTVPAGDPRQLALHGHPFLPDIHQLGHMRSSVAVPGRATAVPSGAAWGRHQYPGRSVGSRAEGVGGRDEHGEGAGGQGARQQGEGQGGEVAAGQVGPQPPGGCLARGGGSGARRASPRRR
ncbi:hypothetical protein STENM327S_09356 [Streptomyces tendae]